MHSRVKTLRHEKRPGFTLIEVLLVLVILVILGSLVAGTFVNTQKKANVKAAKSQIGLFETPIDTFHLALNEYPPNLDALFEAPRSLANPDDWDGPYLKGLDVPLDPWGTPYRYAYPGDRNAQSYDIWSVGPDKLNGTPDDIGNWEG